MKDAPLSVLLKKPKIKTENQLMAFPDSSWKDCPYTGISTGEYIIFYQGWPIDHGTHVLGQVLNKVQTVSKTKHTLQELI